MEDIYWLGIVVIIVLILSGCKGYSECGNSEQIILFYRDSCHFCAQLKDEWNKFTEMAPKYVKIKTVDIANPANRMAVDEYGVQGVPYIVKERNGYRQVYRGNRTALDLLRWSIN